MYMEGSLPEKTILIVDDEESIRRLCVHALAKYRTVVAADGMEALEIVRRGEIDLVLTDIMMPRMGGIELLQAVKDLYPNLIVVIMTGFADKDLILQSLKANANDFITKPLSLLQLTNTVGKALEWQHLREELVELKHMNRLKSQFLGLVSHKLKTPSTSISLFLQNLAEGAIDLDHPDCRAALDEARKELRYLDYLVRDLLYYSDVILEDRSLHLETIALGGVLETVVAGVAAEALERGVALQVVPADPALPSLQLDRKRIAFVLRALLENAIKFTLPGGTVKAAIARTGDELSVRVEDNGIGIRQDELTKIFEKFYQVDPSHCGQVRGFGLGLFYAHQFVQSHGGTIKISSRPGCGTTACVHLPITDDPT